MAAKGLGMISFPTFAFISSSLACICVMGRNLHASFLENKMSVSNNLGRCQTLLNGPSSMTGASATDHQVIYSILWKLNSSYTDATLSQGAWLQVCMAAFWNSLVAQLPDRNGLKASLHYDECIQIPLPLHGVSERATLPQRLVKWGPRVLTPCYTNPTNPPWSVAFTTWLLQGVFTVFVTSIPDDSFFGVWRCSSSRSGRLNFYFEHLPSFCHVFLSWNKQKNFIFLKNWKDVSRLNKVLWQVAF